MSFHDPLWLAALALPVAWLWVLRKRCRPSLGFSHTEGLGELSRRSRPSRLRGPVMLRCLSLALIVVGLARPQQGLESSRLDTEGIDIVLAVDVSTSMLAEDFMLRGARRNRLDVVKDVVTQFIMSRSSDRIGLVVFAGRSYTQVPVTLDHGWLLAQLQRIEVGMVEDGTAIGSGIITGLNRLRSSDATTKILVLLTDGVHNAGTITPDAAAQLAQALGIKVYAIGAGTRGPAPYPTTDLFGRKVYRQIEIQVDDEALTRVAELTGGQYFRATDTESLQAVYQEIDRMEVSRFSEPRYLTYEEWYPWCIVPAIGLLVLSVGFKETSLRVLP